LGKNGTRVAVSNWRFGIKRRFFWGNFKDSQTKTTGGLNLATKIIVVDMGVDVGEEVGDFRIKFGHGEN